MTGVPRKSHESIADLRSDVGDRIGKIRVCMAYCAVLHEHGRGSIRDDR